MDLHFRDYALAFPQLCHDKSINQATSPRQAGENVTQLGLGTATPTPNQDLHAVAELTII